MENPSLETDPWNSSSCILVRELGEINGCLSDERFVRVSRRCGLNPVAEIRNPTAKLLALKVYIGIADVTVRESL